MGQLDGATECPDIWSNITSGCTSERDMNDINISISRPDKADCNAHVGRPYPISCSPKCNKKADPFTRRELLLHLCFN
jgi:hypothetical protein